MTGTLLHGATVITMSPSRPDAEFVDILIEGDRISDIGECRGGPRAESIDLSGRIVIPGLINAHLHTWQGALSSAGADWTLLRESGERLLGVRLGKRWRGWLIG